MVLTVTRSILDRDKPVEPLGCPELRSHRHEVHFVTRLLLQDGLVLIRSHLLRSCRLAVRSS